MWMTDKNHQDASQDYSLPRKVGQREECGRLCSLERHGHLCITSRKGTSLVAQMVKRLPTMQETRVRSLSQEEPLEKDMATHSRTLAWRIPWTDEPGGLQSMGLQRVGHDWATSQRYLPKGRISCTHSQSLQC